MQMTSIFSRQFEHDTCAAAMNASSDSMPNSASPTFSIRRDKVADAYRGAYCLAAERSALALAFVKS